MIPEIEKIEIPKKLLQTTRLKLHNYDTAKAEACADFFSRNRPYLKDAWGDRDEEYYTAKYWEKKLKEDSFRLECGIDARLWLALPANPDRIIGVVGIHCIERGMFLRGKLSYAVCENERGNGYCAEAVAHITETIGFGVIGLRRVEAAIMPRNKASLRVVEKAGFEREGLIRSAGRLNGVWEDHIGYSKINDKV